jgi:archaemetzincin
MSLPEPTARHKPSAGLVTMGRISDMEARVVAANIQSLLNMPVEMLAPMAIPEEAFQLHRGQHDAGLILKRLAESSFPHQRCVLTVTNVDLCTPILTYVFGEAEMGRKMAIVSSFRLRNTRDGLPVPADVYYERLVKVALHEVAHTLSLYHCEEPKCLMRFSPKVQDLDELDIRFCRRCSFALRHTLEEDLK